MLLCQDFDETVEVLVCDDDSTDDTHDILREFASRIRVVARPAGDYRPGRTLNALVRAAKGEYVVFNNADAVPCDRRYLAELVWPLRENTADVTFGNQLPRPDATALVRKDSERAFGDGRVSAAWPRFFSLASSAARRGAFAAFPFREDLLYSEDVEWANRRAMRRVYVPTARVEHSHNYSDGQLRRRFYGEGYADAMIFGDLPAGIFRTTLSALAESVRDGLYLIRSPRDWHELPTSFHRRLLQRFAYRAGVLDAARGLTPATVSTASATAAEAGDVLFIGEHVGFEGGIERYAFAAAEQLQREGRRVDYFGRRPSRERGRFASVFNRVVGRIPCDGRYSRVVLHKLPSHSDLRRLVRTFGDRLEVVVHDHDAYCPRRHYYTPFGRVNCHRA